MGNEASIAERGASNRGVNDPSSSLKMHKSIEDPSPSGSVPDDSEGAVERSAPSRNRSSPAVILSPRRASLAGQIPEAELFSQGGQRLGAGEVSIRVLNETYGCSDIHSVRNHVPFPPAPATQFAAQTAGRIGVELTDGAVKMVQTSIESGFGKVMYSRWQNVINGILGGAFIAVGFFFACVVAGGCPGLKPDYSGLQKLLAGVTFPFGLLMITLTGGELVTSSFSTVGAAWFAGSLNGRHWRAASNLLIIYSMNFLGALLLAGLAHGSGVLADDPYRSYVVGTAEHKVHQDLHTAVVKGIVCNWLVSLAVFLSFAAQDVPGKCITIWPPICAFVTLGMDHCVANMWILPLGIMLGADYSITEMFTHNLIPVTIGNIIGSQMVSVVFNVRFRQAFWEKKDDDIGSKA